MVEGTDPKLKDTYVMFGAHLDHVGYRETGEAAAGAERLPAAQRSLAGAGQGGQDAAEPRRRRAGAAARRAAAPAPVRAAGAGRRRPARRPRRLVPFDQRDFISNGADDDGSGSTAMLAIAKAFATGPKPKRSIVFVWHAGEEAGLLGSRYNADFPVVPLDKVQAQLNMDMVGRDDCNNIEGDYTNTVFVVGADRISTDLHNLIVETNDDDGQAADARLRAERSGRSGKRLHAQRPLQLRGQGHSDRVLHDGTASRLPPGDRHGGQDHCSRRWRGSRSSSTRPASAIANTDKVLERDNKGPRTGFGFAGKIDK